MIGMIVKIGLADIGTRVYRTNDVLEEALVVVEFDKTHTTIQYEGVIASRRTLANDTLVEIPRS